MKRPIYPPAGGCWYNKEFEFELILHFSEMLYASVLPIEFRWIFFKITWVILSYIIWAPKCGQKVWLSNKLRS